ncbi:MAG: hypothetical protein JNN20_04765 [Betaproteobacteria bacterium]|nr:hypothetical protein [Betaproteobacteria bacterium]
MRHTHILPIAILAAALPALSHAQSKVGEQRDGIVWEIQTADEAGSVKGRWKNDNSVCKIVTFHFEKDGKKEGGDYQVALNARESKPMDYKRGASSHVPRISKIETCA